MSAILHETRWVWRSLLKSPAFTIPTVLSLGLAIAANTLIFAFVNILLMTPLPFDHAERLIRIREIHLEPGKEPVPISVAPWNLLEWKRLGHVFAGLAADRPRIINLAGNGEPERVQGGAVSANFLDVIGVKPSLGRGIRPEEDIAGSPERVAMIGDDLWRRRFGGDPKILGQPIHLDGEAYTVIGVLPPQVEFPYQCEIWVPLGLDVNNRSARRLIVFGRLQPGVSLTRAERELQGLARQLARERPETNAGWGVSLKAVRDDLVGDLRAPLVALLWATVCLLLIACGNVASLLLARGIQQHREMALRSALGARGGRLFLPLFCQGLLLALLSGALALLLTAATVKPLARLSPLADMDYFFQSAVRVDLRVLAFGLAVSLAVGVLFSIGPALRLRRPDLQAALKEGGRGSGGRVSQRALSSLVIWEIALATVLLASAGLMIKSFQKQAAVAVGFDPDRILIAQLALSPSKYPNGAAQAAFFQELLTRVSALPGVVSAAVDSTHPFNGDRRVVPFSVERRQAVLPGEVLLANFRVISPELFPTLRIPLLQGRGFTPADRAGAPLVTVVSKRFASVYWPGENPLGKRLRREGMDGIQPWITVVGVVGDVLDLGDVRETWYLPLLQEHDFFEMSLMVRTQGAPEALAAPVRKAVWSIAPEQPVFGVQSLRQAAAIPLLEERFAALMYGLFGILGLILSATGTYGVMSYSVAQRSQEFGIRSALGATSGNLYRLVLRWAGLITLAGMGLGVAGAFFLTRLLTHLLFGVTPADPANLALALAVLAATALAASYLPARRASRVEPVSVLRSG
jgi:predicted permease